MAGVLRSVIPVYDKVNVAISLGKANKYRWEGIKGHVHPGNKILDAGSGFGNMSRIASKITDQHLEMVLYDPLLMMLSRTRNFLPDSSNQYLSSGVFEYMPFKEQVFDAVLCGYSLRDAIELESAIAEIYRVLKKGGSLVVVDLGKPDNKFQTIHGTYKKWPRNSELHSLLSRRFSKVKFKTGLMGAAVIVVAYK